MNHHDSLFVSGWLLAGLLHLLIVVFAFLDSKRWGILVLVLPLASLAFMARLPRTVLPLVVGQMLALTLTWPSVALREEEARDKMLYDERREESERDKNDDTEARRERIEGEAMMKELMARIDAREFLLQERTKALKEASAVVAAWHGLISQTMRLRNALEIPTARLDTESAAYRLLHTFVKREQDAIAREYEQLASGRAADEITLPARQAPSP